MQQTDTFQQCIDKAYADAAKASPDKVNEKIEAAAAIQAATDSSVKTLAGASAVSVGRAFGGFQPGVPAATNAAFQSFGADVQTILRRSSPLVSVGGLAISAYSVGGATLNGYKAGGVSGATTALSYSSADAALDYGLVSSLGVLGIPAAYGLDKLGGSRALLSSMELQNALQGCAAKAGYMAPPTAP